MNEDLVIKKADYISQIQKSIEFIYKHLYQDIKIFKMDDDQLYSLEYYLDIIVNNIKYGKIGE